MVRTTAIAVVGALFLVAAPFYVGPASADPAEGVPGAQDAELMQVQQRLQELQQELGRIQQETLADNESLQTREKDLEERVIAKMEDLGYDPESHIARREEILERFESQELSQSEQQELAQELQIAHMALQRAQQEVWQDEAFRESMERDMRALHEDMIAAMEEAYPETADLMSEYQELFSKLQEQMHRHGEQLR
ncbi:hypothetical protein CKO15_07590 [Halorhodospira abdelmalekii]|uniref:hypothetical protein n=1 Tax=Halorhodospira abdelmalekii TaxID=421629 RepID=UPI0019030E60|nr:hypothetical protein [Halorhodospira abdelmalekii]MBK1735147.1 hypothetical protein [Halorhodospira abdelmalekii]